MGTKGGKRAGAGRKPGSKSKTTVQRLEIAKAALDKGLTPLEYMLGLMRDEAQDEKIRREMAIAAAPYTHARLAAVEVTGKEGGPLRYSAVEDLPPEDAYAKLTK